MPLFSMLRKLVGSEETDTVVSQPQPQQVPASPPQEKTPPTPPLPPLSAPALSKLPPKMNGSLLAATPSTTSMTSLRSQLEAERQTASSSSVYKDFTGTGHADGGHWNDPPTAVFKQQAASSGASSPYPTTTTPANKADEDKCSQIAEDIVKIPDSRQGQEDAIKSKLHAAVDQVSIDSAPATPMIKRVVEDTNKRLTLLDERLPELKDDLVREVCRIAMLIDQGSLKEAVCVHRDLIQAGHDNELKWLVGIKRIIELHQKHSAK